MQEIIIKLFYKRALKIISVFFIVFAVLLIWVEVSSIFKNTDGDYIYPFKKCSEITIPNHGSPVKVASSSNLGFSLAKSKAKPGDEVSIYIWEKTGFLPSYEDNDTSGIRAVLYDDQGKRITDAYGDPCAVESMSRNFLITVPAFSCVAPTFFNPKRFNLPETSGDYFIFLTTRTDKHDCFIEPDNIPNIWDSPFVQRVQIK